MKRILITTVVLLALLLPGMAMSMGSRGPSVGVVVTVPILPPVVEFDSEPYYYQDGYHYHYNDSRWYYAKSRRGPWESLPRDHYPKEVRYKNKGGQHDQGRDQDNRGHKDKGHDNRRDDDRGHNDRGRD
ncbi:hypothetical protein JCM30471_03160 [Desulfuromonas carbonis]|nr:hypothetical protein DBW_1264 [Desulfuromonas sp. DDH964]